MSQIQPESKLKTDRSRLRRAHEKGAYDRDSLNAVLDAMPMCHIGYQIGGKPSVLPTRSGGKAAMSTGMDRQPAAPCGPWSGQMSV